MNLARQFRVDEDEDFDQIAALFHPVQTPQMIFESARHPYTRALLQSFPRMKSEAPEFTLRATLEGEPPSPIDLPRGCRFQARCPVRKPHCEESEPELLERSPGHRVACFEAR